jgi:hypothetical protein
VREMVAYEVHLRNKLSGHSKTGAGGECSGVMGAGVVVGGGARHGGLGGLSRGVSEGDGGLRGAPQEQAERAQQDWSR